MRSLAATTPSPVSSRRRAGSSCRASARATRSFQQFAQEADGLRSRPRLEHLRVQLQQANGWFTGQRVVVDATLTGAGAGQHPQVIRQLMFLNPPFGYVLTLVAPQDQGPARYRDLDDTASSLIPLAVLLPADAGSPSDGGTAATPHPG